MITGQNSENSKELVPSKETGLSKSDFKFSKDEIEGEMGSSAGGYNKEYSYFLKASPAAKQFEIIDNATDLVVHQAEKLNVVMYYGHNIYKLLQGHLEGLTGDHRKWGADSNGDVDKDENKRLSKIVAITYNSPFSQKNKSTGNFVSGGFGDWLTTTAKREILEKRQCVVLLIPELINKGVLQQKPVFGSFGGSSIIPWSTYKKSVDASGLPLFMVNTTLSFESDKNRNDDVYNKVVFDFAKNEKNEPTMNGMFSNMEEAKGKWGIGLRKQVENLHLEYVRQAESGELLMGSQSEGSSPIEAEVNGVSSTNGFPPMDEPFNDDIPF